MDGDSRMMKMYTTFGVDYTGLPETFLVISARSSEHRHACWVTVYRNPVTSWGPIGEVLVLPWTVIPV